MKKALAEDNAKQHAKLAQCKPLQTAKEWLTHNFSALREKNLIESANSMDYRAQMFKKTAEQTELEIAMAIQHPS